MKAGGARRRLVIGIDLGTTHSVVAWADRESQDPPKIFAIPQLVTPTEVEARPLLPSFLYAALPGEALADPWGDAPWVIGEAARKRGTEVPGRLIASAKSWLIHPSVDRTAPILPWGAGEDAPDLPRLSPVDASARILSHIRRAWDDAFPNDHLADQDVILTVPASFDEVARELTVEAARLAGLPATTKLLEEPQAAFYHFMESAGADGLRSLIEGDEDGGGGRALVLVCDVGGGTTDLSLIQVERPPSDSREQPPVVVKRVAVGHHLLLGGDNMDLALALLCEPRLTGGASTSEASSGAAPGKLDPGRFGQLVLACRAAKERLLKDNDLTEAPVTILGSGSKLIGGSLTTRLKREEVEKVVLDGFFPLAPRDAKPQRTRSALVAFGLPYERDVAITRHVAWFFSRHAPNLTAPTALLFNGGVFRGARVAERLTNAIEAWGGPALRVLPFADPDLAVALGAVAYGLALSGRGVRIEGGAAHGYYIGLDAPSGDDPRPAICVVPRGAKEGARQVARGRPLALVVGRPVRFDLFASDDAATHSPGEIVPLDEDRFRALPPVAVAFGAEGSKGRGAAEEVRVELEGELSAIGTLELACVEVNAPKSREPRRFRLAFQLRGDETSQRGADDDTSASTSGAAKTDARRTPGGKKLDEAREAIDRVFGKGRQDVAPREVKSLVRELERILGERPTWTTELARALYDSLIKNSRSRRRSAEHERVFWSLAGYCLRPGYGDPEDPARIHELWPLFAERLAFSDEPRSWQQLWIAWRRVVGGLDEAAQTAIRDVIDPFFAPAEKKLKKPKGLKPEALDDLLELISSLERVSPSRRSELGGWLLERTWTARDPRLWAAIGRIGARVPTYASVHHVVSATTADRWLDHLLREKWDDLPTAPQAAFRLARVTDDRARDVSPQLRREVRSRLEKVGADPAWIRAVSEYVAASQEERAAFFGEGLPVGLRLLD